MAIKQTNATWTQIDTDSLPANIAAAYTAYKAAYVTMKAERLEFETKLAAMLTVPPGKRAVFGYNFGKLSIAIVDDTAKPKAASSAVSLASLIKKA